MTQINFDYGVIKHGKHKVQYRVNSKYMQALKLFLKSKNRFVTVEKMTKELYPKKGTSHNAVHVISRMRGDFESKFGGFWFLYNPRRKGWTISLTEKFE